MFEEFRREMHLRDVSGHQFSMSLSRVRASMLTRKGLTFLALAVLMLLFSDPPGFLNHLSIGMAALIWKTALICHLAGLFTLLDLSQRWQMRHAGRIIWLPLVSLCALVPTVCASEILVFAFVGAEYEIILLRKVIFYFVIVQIMEFAFIRFILIDAPTPRNGDGIPRPVAQEERSITLGDRRLPLRRLRYVSAQEHYVEVVMDADRLLQRARLSDVVAQMRDQDGVQPHRSWWVSRNAAPHLEKRGARYVILTEDSTEVPVARGRVADVVAWFDQHGPFT
ncbi:MAG: LytTR family transcriptional regulator [Okeania sp. SIO3H1]|nr:LytTR family transcriptional regulator [Okeania sp. SIO3H1]